MSSIQSLRGMADLLPIDMPYWHALESTIHRSVELYNYQEIRVPVLESTGLFKRGIGEQTDIVEKEMYTFQDLSGDSVTLRPEATASVVRAGLQHGLFHNQKQQLWYMGPMFRYERPQRGRFRQFHQFGAEVFGYEEADRDVEIIALSHRILHGVHLNDVRLHINTLGNDSCRSNYRKALKDYLIAHKDKLDDDSKRRVERNPLRVLDSKDDSTQAVLENAPRFDEYLDSQANQHFARICSMLEDIGISVTVDAKLVRGLDYYTSTVFEWTTDQLGAQSAVCGGGRYDNLVSELGGKQPTPAVGFAMGLERLIELMKINEQHESTAGLFAFAIPMDEDCAARLMLICEQMRNNALSVQLASNNGSVKSRFKQADASGASIALILGADELANNQIQIKYLRDKQEPKLVPLDNIVSILLAVNDSQR